MIYRKEEAPNLDDFALVRRNCRDRQLRKCDWETGRIFNREAGISNGKLVWDCVGIVRAEKLAGVLVGVLGEEKLASDLVGRI